ncbi:hypothetical protein OIU78_025721 [Salix suchowensis]|nr:hypothetical protein OIU78_025721 [Salix suchowensis]
MLSAQQKYLLCSLLLLLFNSRSILRRLYLKGNAMALKSKQDRNLSKGVYGTMEFKEGDLIMKDKILVGIQHVPNKLDCLVCGNCFQFIEKGYEILGECSSSSSDNKVRLSEGVIEALMNGELVLPYSEHFPLPSTVRCPGGCEEAYYCSKSCAETDWESSHSLLCTGERSESVSIEALSKFIQHATETNDIFLLAAKTISFIILRHGSQYQWDTREGGGIAFHFQMMLIVLMTLHLGCKYRQLAFKSLQLLKAAIFDEECEPLFSLEIYGNIIGMFELNNLDLVVASPVEDYFLYIDDLPDPEKMLLEMAIQFVAKVLHSIPLQSCINHSCCPNAHAFKRDEDRDGQAAIVTLKPIRKGEEVTISYIDEDLPFEDRQALLEDYGFKCRCNTCLEEDPSKK